MTITKRVIAPLAITAMLVFAGAACGGSSGGSASSFCDTYEKLNSDDILGDADFTDEAAMKKVQSAFKELKASAPSEIKGALDTISGAIDAMANIDMEDPDQLAELSEKFDLEEYEAASEKIEDYVAKNCKVKSTD